MGTSIHCYTNLKGGVGKTTTAIHTIYAAADAGYKVLAVDLDPQNNLSEHMLGGNSTPTSFADVLTGGVDATSVVYASPTHGGIDVIPSGGLALQVAAEIAHSRGSGEQRIRKTIHTLAPFYDMIVIDTGPNLSVLTRGAILSATSIVLVTQPEPDSISGIATVAATIAALADDYDKNIPIGGVIVNLIDYRRKDHLAQLEYLKENYPVIQEIPTRSSIATATHNKHSLAQLPIVPAPVRNIASGFTNTVSTLIA